MNLKFWQKKKRIKLENKILRLTRRGNILMEISFEGLVVYYQLQTGDLKSDIIEICLDEII